MALEPGSQVPSSGLTVAYQTFDEVGVWRHPIHPPPPTQLTEWLQDTIARSPCESRYPSNARWVTYKSNTKLNSEVKINPDTSGVGAMAATACPMVV